MLGGPLELENVSLAKVRVPEGFITVIHCRHCGGRDEHLTDVQALKSDADGMRDAAVQATRAADFATHHAACHMRPHQHRADEDVTSFVDNVATAAASIICSGKTVVPTLYVLDDTDAYAFELPLASLRANDEASWRITVAILQRDIRQFIREEHIAVRAVVSVGSGWSVAPSPASLGAEGAAERREMMAVTVVTPTAGRLALAPVSRSARSDDDGKAASVGTLEWNILDQWAPMTDGVLATSKLVTHPDRSMGMPTPPLGWMAGTGGTAVLVH